MAFFEWIGILGIVACASGSFFFALAESALFALGRFRAQHLSEGSPELKAKFAKLIHHPQDLLAALVLGNTLANAGLVATSLAGVFYAGWPLGLTLALLVPGIIIGCEVTPKTLAVRAPELWSLRVLTLVNWITSVTEPIQKLAARVNKAVLVWIVPATAQPKASLTEEEYQDLLEMAAQQGALTDSEKDIILRILRLDRQTAKEVMRPRSQIAAISDELSIEEMVEEAKKFKHQRLPIYDATPDTIVGILNTRALLLNPNSDLSEVIEFPSFVPETMNLLQLLKSLQRQRRGLAIVMDEYGGTAGLVTMEDILEEVVGEFRDSSGPEAVLQKLGIGRWRATGALKMEELRQEFPELAGPPGVETIGGLLAHQLEVIPAKGQSIQLKGLRLTAEEVDERRVRQVLIESVKKGASAP